MDNTERLALIDQYHMDVEQDIIDDHNAWMAACDHTDLLESHNAQSVEEIFPPMDYIDDIFDPFFIDIKYRS